MTEVMIHNRSTIALLEKLGLSRNEIRCYLALLAIGSAKTSEIAKAAHVHRVNTYATINKLIQRGLVVPEIVSRGSKLYSAPHEQLLELAQNHQNQSAKLRWKIEDFVAGLRTSSLGEKKKYPVLIFEGSQAIFTILERSLTVPEKTEILRIGLFADGDPISLKEYHMQEYDPARITHGCFLRYLVLKNKRYADMIYLDPIRLREVRFLPPSFSENVRLSQIIIYTQEVGLYWHAPRPMGIIIKNEQTAEAMRMLFNIVWGVSEKPKPKGKN